MLRGLAVWLLIILAETVHGTLRQFYLVPRVGEAMANRIGWPVGLAIVLAVAFLCARWVGLGKRAALLRLGAVWALLTLVFEVAVGLARGFDRERIAAEINPLTGGLMLWSLAVMVLAPLVAARLRRLF
ncbi:MAG: hypothetical protein HY245_06175 [Rhizobiales bacterium]|nr:hypothetical protein [Hyphomicrobiales bacterium]MBI3672991.1 hypothetical protein [Hyphomicrobiales bacterium]